MHTSDQNIDHALLRKKTRLELVLKGITDAEENLCSNMKDESMSAESENSPERVKEVTPEEAELYTIL